MNYKLMYFRIFFYSVGCIFLAFGITLSTKTGLGVSPVISMPFVISSIWNLNFSAMIFIIYSLLVALEFLLRRPDYRWKDLLQIPFSFVFSFLMGFFDTMPIHGFSSLWQNLLLLSAAIIFTGIGAAMMINTNLIPNPADGLAHTIGEVSKKGMGFGKNILDISSVLISCLLCFLFVHKLVGIGIGTILAMFGVGRVIFLFNYFCYTKTSKPMPK